jgi:hypothetical protein
MVARSVEGKHTLEIRSTQQPLMRWVLQQIWCCQLLVLYYVRYYYCCCRCQLPLILSSHEAPYIQLLSQRSLMLRTMLLWAALQRLYVHLTRS